MSNPYALSLYNEIQNRFSVDASNMPMSEWICRNTTLRGVPFSFRKFPFQKQIVDDMHPNLCVTKISQIGLTETQIRKAAAFVTRNRGVTLLFTFPSEDMQKRTSQTRIQPLITENGVFNRAKEAGTTQIRSVGIIQIESSFLLVTSCTEGEATSTPADAVFNDEVDLSDPGILALFSSRMQASDWKLRQQFSTPTFSGYGIDQTYAVSDQHEYLLKCDSCNHWQLPLFTRKFIRLPGLPDSVDLAGIDQAILDNNRIDLDTAFVACERCGSELDLGRGDNRNWVALHPHRTNARGYRVRPFSVNTLSPKYIIEKMLEYKRKGFMRGWYNTVLGETYEDGDIRLTDVQINACFEQGHPERFRDVDPTRTPLFLGIDLGLVCHITVLAPRDRRSPRLQDMEVVCFEPVPVELLIERVKWYQQNFLVVAGGTDRHPYTPTANAVFEASGNIVVPYEYRGSAELSDKSEIDKTIQINRTMAIDTVAQLVRTTRLVFSGYGDQKDTINLHLKNMVREESPEKPAVWKKLGGPSTLDHYFHSLVFAYSALRFYLGEFSGSESSMDKRQTVWVAPAGTTATAAMSGLTSIVGAGQVASRGRQATVGFNRLR